MGKGDKRGKHKPMIAELATIPRKQPNGRLRQRSDSPRDARRAALSARCRKLGLMDNKQNRKDVSAQHMSDAMGWIMDRECKPDQIRTLSGVWSGMLSAHRTYSLRYLGQSGSPKGATMAMVTEKMETDKSHSVDLRSPEERDRDAVSNWMRWQGYLGCLSARDRALLADARQQAEDTLWQRAKPTGRGLNTLTALKALADVVENT